MSRAVLGSISRNDGPPADREASAACTVEPALRYPASCLADTERRLTLDDFEISRSLLGEGKFGRVFRAREKESRRVVVIKSIDKQAVVEEGVKGQLQREIEVHCRLRHPNIVRMFAYFDDDERGTRRARRCVPRQRQSVEPSCAAVYIVLECVSGGNVYQRLQESPGKRFSEPLAASLIQQLCR